MPTLAVLASVLDLKLRGDPTKEIYSLGPLGSAGPEQLSFLSEKRHLSRLTATKAGAIILHPEWLDNWSGCALLSESPYLAYARATRIFDNHPAPAASIHERAIVADDVSVGNGVTIDAGACIESGVVLGDNVWIGAGAYVGHSARIGNGSVLKTGVVICHSVRIGSRCTIHPNATIGSDGFGFALGPNGWERIGQLASVVIGDEVEIGANTTVDRGALEDTIIEDGVIIDNLVQVAHGVRIGTKTAIAAQVGIAGGTQIGAGCQIAGQAGVVGHVKLADDVKIGGQGRVARSIKEPGHYCSGTPLQPLKSWLRSSSKFTQLDQMSRRINELEKGGGRPRKKRGEDE